MEDTLKDELGAPRVVNRSTFQAELDALRIREKAHTREGDAIAAARRRLPMVEVDGATPLRGERGAAPRRSKTATICSTSPSTGGRRGGRTRRPAGHNRLKAGKLSVPMDVPPPSGPA